MVYFIVMLCKINQMNFIKIRCQTIGVRLTLVAVFFLGTSQLMYSQNALVASGGDATGSGGSSSYSIGQVVYSTYSNENGSVSEGVQHPIELVTLTNAELKSVSLSAVLYPNPAQNYIVLSITDKRLTALRYGLYDIQGKQVGQGIIDQPKIQIGLQHLESAVYLLKVTTNQTELKTFKIIKN